MKSIKSTLQATTALSIIVILLLLTLPVSTALADTSGPYNAGTGSNITDIGTEAWQNPGNITTPGIPYATVTLYHGYRFSNYLEGTRYGFTIPADAPILGIEVKINRMFSGHPNVYDNMVSMVRGGAIVGDNKAITTVAWPTIFAEATYGGATDLWGTTWTSADINSPDFGVALAAYRDNNGNPTTDVNVDSMQITVYYKYSTTTSVECGDGSPVIYGDSIICVATVTRSTSSQTPSGTVSWTTDGSGSFVPNPCTLAGTNGVATCTATYTPTAVGSGTHTLTATYSGDQYFDPGSDNQTITVNPKAASVTSNTALKTYGDLDPTLTGTLTGFLPADNVSATYSRTAGENVLDGPYTINATLSPAGGLSNYTITSNTAVFTILPKAASVTPNTALKTYGELDPSLTGTLTGFLPADNVSATYSRTAGEAVLGGPYTISATLSPAGVLSNYTITSNTSVFTILPKAVSVTPNAASKTYGNSDPTLTGTLSGFLVADGVTATYSRTAGETVLGSPYTIGATLHPAGVLSNYTIIYNTANFTIPKRLITVTADVKSKLVSQPDPTLTYKITSGSLAFSDAFSGFLIRDAGESVGTYAIRQGTLTINVNYTLTYVGAYLTIGNQFIYIPMMFK